MAYLCQFEQNLAIGSKDRLHTRLFYSYTTPVTLKITSKSPNSNHSFQLSRISIRTSFIKIHPTVHKLVCRQKAITTLTPTRSTPRTVSRECNPVWTTQWLCDTFSRMYLICTYISERDVQFSKAFSGMMSM